MQSNEEAEKTEQETTENVEETEVTKTEVEEQGGKRLAFHNNVLVAASMEKIQPPKLRSMEPAAIRTFLRKYKTYVGEATKFKERPRGLTMCLETEVLDVLCVLLGRFSMAERTCEQSDQELLRVLEESAGMAQEEIRSDDLRTLLQATVAQAAGGPYSVAAAVVGAVVKKFDDLRVEITEIPEKQTLIVAKVMVSVLKPVAFKDYMSTRLRTSLDLNADAMTTFLSQFMAEAKKFHEAYRVVEGSGRGQQRVHVPKASGRQAFHRGSVPSTDTVRERSEEEKKRPEEEKKAEVLTRGARVHSGLKCLGCGEEGHPLFRCPKMSEEQRKAKMEELKKAGIQLRGASTRRVRTITVPARGIGRRRLARMAHESEGVGAGEGVSYTLDSGADVSLMSAEHLRKLAKETDSLLQELRKPLKLRGFAEKGGTGDDFIECTHLIVTRFELETRYAPVLTPPVEIYVLPDGLSMDHILLGRPLLREMGLDPEERIGASGRPSEENGAEAAVVRRVGVIFDDEGFDESVVEVDSADSLGLEPDVALCEDFKEDQKTHKAEVEALLANAVGNGMERRWAERLRAGVLRLGCWRTAIGGDPPARARPYEAKLKDGAVPVRARLPRYSDPQLEVIRAEVRKMAEAGLIEPMPEARFSSPVLIVKKPDGSPRIVVDLRRVNKLVEEVASQLPDHRAQERRLRGSKVYALLDLAKGFWQLPVEGITKEVYALLTPDGVYATNRLMMGVHNASAVFQSRVGEALGGLLGVVCELWVDDILIHGESTEQLVERLEAVVGVLDAQGWKLNVKKCSLWQDKVVWCGKLYSAAGIMPDPRKVQALGSMSPPTTLGELQQFIGAVGWIRQHIIDYEEGMRHLRTFLEEKLSKLGSRRKAQASKLRLVNLGWGVEEVQAFERAKRLVRDATLLYYPDPSKSMKVFTDASKDGWSVVVVQLKPDNWDKPLNDQEMEPLYFLSGSFKGASAHWNIVEKEAYALYIAAVKLPDILDRQRGFYFVCDSLDVVFLMDPKRIMPQSGAATVSKIHRWALYLSEFKFGVEHVAGSLNVWADLLSRWGQAKTVPDQAKVFRVIRDGGHDAGVMGPHDSDFEWPIITQPGVIDEDLKRRLMIVAHGGLNGHRGVKLTLQRLKEHDISWPGMEATVKAFVKACVHCRANAPILHKRMFGIALRGKARNDVLHMDFLYMGKSRDDYKYLLVLEDGFTGFALLHKAVTCDAKEAAEGILQWISLFGDVRVLCSDRGPHFMNSVVRNLAERLRIRHHFVCAHAPWANGTVERLNKEVLTVCKKMLSELRLPPEDWTVIVPMILSAINRTPSRSREGLEPVRSFMALQGYDPLSLVLRGSELLQMDTVAVSQATVKLREVLDDMHMKILTAQERRELTIRQKNELEPGAGPEFVPGDYVMVTDVRKERTKLMGKKLGPMMVTEMINDWVYVVKDLTSGTTRQVHAERLEWYADSKLLITEPLKEQLRYQLSTYEMEKFLGHRFHEGSWEIYVKWKGFQEEEATWQSVDSLAEVAPVWLTRYIEATTVPEELRVYIRYLLELN